MAYLDAKAQDDVDNLTETAMLLAEMDLKSGNNRRVLETLDYLTDSAKISIPDSLIAKLYITRGSANFQLGRFQSAKEDFYRCLQNCRD